MKKIIPNKLQIYFFVGLLLIVTGLMFMLFKPFLSAITIAAILAVALYPWYQRITALLGGRKSLAALLVILLMLLVVIAPLTLIGKQTFNETRSLYQYLSTTPGIQLDQLPDEVRKMVVIFAPDLNLELNTYIQSGAEWLIGNLGRVFSGTIEVLLGLYIVLISLFFFLKDGEKLKDFLIELSPLDDQHDNTIVTRLHQTVFAVVVGTIAIAIAQGILVSIGFLIFGVPNIMLWGMMAALSALVPGVGTSLVTIPAVIYLLFTGNAPAAIGLLIWSIILVGLIDNVLMPVFYSRGNHVHPVLILFAVLGGLSAFGPVGFLLGPIILSIFLALLHISQLLVAASGNHKNSQ